MLPLLALPLLTLLEPELELPPELAVEFEACELEELEAEESFVEPLLVLLFVPPEEPITAPPLDETPLALFPRELSPEGELTFELSAVGESDGFESELKKSLMLSDTLSIIDGVDCDEELSDEFLESSRFDKSSELAKSRPLDS